MSAAVKTLLILFSKCLILTAIAFQAAAVPPPSNPRVTIIIDDLGNNWPLGKRAVELPGDITYAVLPGTPQGPKLADMAHQKGSDVILHLPMESEKGMRLGPGGLTTEMDRARFRRQLQDNLAAVPHIIGINNHMGSLLTQRPTPMNWVMEAIKNQGFFFIDSRTTPNSVARKIAFQHRVPSLTRDIFLDHHASKGFIHQQFEKMIRVVQWQGFAVAVGHPYPATLNYLEKHIPRLKQRGIHLISASEMLKTATSPTLPKQWYARLKSIAELPLPDSQKLNWF